MRRPLPLSALALALVCTAAPVGATERSFVYTQQSRVLAPGESELQPWTTFRVGRERYYSGLDARLKLEHGFAPGLQLALYWNFEAQSQDVIENPLTGKIVRESDSQLAGASLELKYQLSDPAADAVGSALYLEATIGPNETELEAKLIADRSLGKWLLAANVSAQYELSPIRNDAGTELETAFELEPALAAAYALPHGFSVGLELRAPLELSGEAKSKTLFGGPVVAWVDHGYWASIGVAPQLVAFSGASAGSHLDLTEHERLETRLLVGFLL